MQSKLEWILFNFKIYINSSTSNIVIKELMELLQQLLILSLYFLFEIKEKYSFKHLKL